jgi:hypothetical protein
MGLFHNFVLIQVECGQIRGIACVAYTSASPRYTSDLLAFSDFDS